MDQNILDLTLADVKGFEKEELLSMIASTKDFAKTLGVSYNTEKKGDCANAVRAYLRKKMELPEETEKEKEQEDPGYVAKQEGFSNVDVNEYRNPEQAMAKAGFQSKEEMLQLLEGIRRDMKLLEIRKEELARKEEDFVKRETVLLGREAHFEKKAAEISEKLAEYKMLFERVQAAREKGIIS